MLFAFLSALFLPNLYPWKSGFMELAYAFTPLNFTLGKIAISFLIGIPIIMIIYMAIKLLFSFKSNNKVIALSPLVLDAGTRYAHIRGDQRRSELVD